MIRAVAIVLWALAGSASAWGCRDEEQRARAAGEAARAEVARACAAAQPSIREDEDGAEADAERSGCARRGCEPPCAPFAGSAAFHRACVTACTADAECRTDAD